jgi:hypothetical protein
MSKFRLQTTQVAGYPNLEGQFVFADDQLVAVLVHLSEEDEGCRFTLSFFKNR